MAKFIAFYLPQYHPTNENDKWWGPGFTDWRTVNMAKPLFRDHVQPKVPRELGYYDLRLEESRIQQGDMAQKFGVDAFCYWHYWFGDGKRLLNIPFDEVVKSGKPQISFCLGWANHSWFKKAWGGTGKDLLLCEQKYLGEQDDILHFKTMLPAFKDKRYFRHNGKMVFIIYEPLANEHIKEFIATWRTLAKEYNLGDFFFIGKDSYSNNKEKIFEMGFDAIYNDNIFGILHRESKIKKAIRFLKQKLFNLPMVFEYKDAIKYMVTEEEKEERVIPTIVPNWDHSPRSGSKNPIFINSKPDFFKRLVSNVCDVVRNKNNDIVIIKSWNEWGEGNYLEPDMQYGMGMLEALRDAKS